MKKGTLIPEILLFILSLILVFGVRFVFSACGISDEGTYMSCHWAQEAVFAVALIMMAISFGGVLGKKNIYLQSGFLISIVPCALIEIIIPGRLIALCITSDMACRSLMRPSVILINTLILVIDVAALIVNLKKMAH